MSIKYLPAISISNKIGFNFDRDLQVDFNKKNLLDHDSYLFSYPYAFHDNDRFDEMRKSYGTKMIFGDSGGFQLAQLKQGIIEKNKITDSITANNVIKWMEKYCDRGMNLDIPPLVGNNTSYNDEFSDSLRISLDNFEYFKKNRDKKSKLKLYNVMHGKDKHYMDLWFTEANKYKFEGWAIGFKTRNAISRVCAMLFLYDRLRKCNDSLDNYDLHMLGFSDYESIMLYGYFSLYYKGLLTFDASTFTIGSRYRIIMNEYEPFNEMDFQISPYISGGNDFFKGLSAENKDTHEQFVQFKNSNYIMPCLCRSCSYWNELVMNIKINEDILMNKIGFIIDMHNSSLIKQSTEKINHACKYNPSYFKSIISNLAREKFSTLQEATNIIDQYFVNGQPFDSIADRYRDIFQQTTYQNFSNRNINSLDKDLFE